MYFKWLFINCSSGFLVATLGFLQQSCNDIKLLVYPYVTLNDFDIRKFSDRYRIMYTFICLNGVLEETSVHINFLDIMI